RRTGDDDQGFLSLVAFLCQDDVWQSKVSMYRVQYQYAVQRNKERQWIFFHVLRSTQSSAVAVPVFAVCGSGCLTCWSCSPPSCRPSKSSQNCRIWNARTSRHRSSTLRNALIIRSCAPHDLLV